MQFATRIKGRTAFRANGPAVQILANGQFSTTNAAQNSLLVELSTTPDASVVAGFCLVTIKAGIVGSAAFELDRDDIKRTAIVGAARTRIDSDTMDQHT